MTRLVLIFLIWWVLLAPVALVAWVVRCRRERLERERIYQFWASQCNKSLSGMARSKTDEEYEQWNEAMRVNMRRYEQEVLGR